MPERITRDTGMMQRTDIKYRMDDPREVEGCIAAFKAWADSFPVAEPGDWPGDALHRHNAGRCRAILATVALSDDGKCAVNTGPLREKGLAENSAQWIAAHWLAEYNALRRGRERFEAGDVTPGNLSRMLMATEEMGRLQERMWWRAGVDPDTKAKRETLALERKKSRLALRNNPDRNHERKVSAAQWSKVAQDLANAYWRRHPRASKVEVAQAVLRKWPQENDAPKAPSVSSVRQRIVQPKIS